MSQLTEKVIVLNTCDKIERSVTSSTAKKMGMIAIMLEDLGNSDEIIPLSMIRSAVLDHIIDLVSLTETDQTEFLSKLSHQELKSLVNATNYLQMDALFKTICIYIRDMIEILPQKTVNQFFTT